MNVNLADRIAELKNERDAVILAHNYTPPEVQDIADICGDSLGLSRQAAATKNKVIVFCGVKFMAETAKILSPDKTVLMPDEKAGCPMADMIEAEDVRRMKNEHLDAVVVCYVNSSAEVKAECDICVTSSNAVDIIKKIPSDKKVIFVPDRYLASYTANQLNRDIIYWNGFCPTHFRLTPEKIKVVKEQYPDAEVLVHPECTKGVIDVADKALSTGQMLNYLKEKDSGTFIIGTENGMIHPLQKANANVKLLVVADDILCPNMKKNSLEKIMFALEDMAPEITVPEEIAEKARKSLTAGLLE